MYDGHIRSGRTSVTFDTYGDARGRGYDGRPTARRGSFDGLSRWPSGDDALRRVRRENETLYAVIKTVSSSLDLDRVLDGIVDIATDATGCHACFIYFLDGDRLVLRAASPRYSHLVGQLELGDGRGPDGLGRAHQDARVHPRPRAGGSAR